MNKLGLLAIAILFLGVAAHAQQFDVAFGVSGINAPSSSSAGSNNTPVSLGSGLYPGFSGDFLIRHHFGVNAQVDWRAHQGNYLDIQPYRPLFYDFNAIYAPPIGKHAQAEIYGGIGAESIRFYQQFVNCSFTGCTNYTSTTHFMGDVGVGLRLYVHGGLFVRPEAQLYLIHNNVEFSSGRAARIGLSVGYSFGER